MNELKPTLLIVDAGVRYWEDARVNGVKDESGTLIPFRSGERWKPVIDLATGKILDWPKGTVADIHYKVCDDGYYWIDNGPTGDRLKWKGDYVPDDFLCAGNRGYGDYIILKINEDGLIQGWKTPMVDINEWKELN